MNAKKILKKINESILNESDPDVIITFSPRVREISLKFGDTPNRDKVKTKIKTMTVDDHSDLAKKFNLPISIVSACLDRCSMMSNFTLFSKTRQDADKLDSLFKAVGCNVVYVQV